MTSMVNPIFFQEPGLKLGYSTYKIYGHVDPDTKHTKNVWNTEFSDFETAETSPSIGNTIALSCRVTRLAHAVI